MWPTEGFTAESPPAQGRDNEGIKRKKDALPVDCAQHYYKYHLPPQQTPHGLTATAAEAYVLLGIVDARSEVYQLKRRPTRSLEFRL